MKINLYELNIIIDTLIGTQNLADGGTLFKYTAEGRRQVGLKLLEEMRNVDVNIEVDKE